MKGVPAWLADATAALRSAYGADRMPHALLLHEAPGAGGEWLATWAAQLVLCTQPGKAPCLACVSCRRVAAQQHPDLGWLRPTEESRQIRIEAVRELTAELALTSHGGGYRVAIVSPADALNRYAANAFLKTLEEPPPRTLLVLVASQPSRLPATVRSRCLRLRLGAPARADALAWLTATHGAAPWEAALDVLGEAPFLAIQSDPAAVAATGAESRSVLEALAAGHADPVATAEQWAKSELPLRLRCFENWLTERLGSAARGGGFLTEMRAGPYLPGARTSLNMRALYGLIDEVRDMRATLDVPLNRSLALEGLFRRLAPASGGRGRGAE